MVHLVAVLKRIQQVEKPSKWRYNLEGVEFALSGGGDHKVKQKYDNLQSMEKLKEKIA